MQEIIATKQWSKLLYMEQNAACCLSKYKYNKSVKPLLYVVV